MVSRRLNCRNSAYYHFLILVIECDALSGMHRSNRHTQCHRVIITRTNICIRFLTASHTLHPVAHV
ncbi:MAG: hypothetical protein KAW19_10215, partial [Candidatus Aminicenantes bacterium]|nr:hypothetical protein [Candidatus Aminicenantes bacterium]